ncbi:MAG: dihydrolipoyl dehydrogenase [Ignavibacteriaceae bacterium]
MLKQDTGNNKKYDAIIIGSGQSGNPLAKDLASDGWKVAIIEKNFVGGSCINYGCTPSKTMAASAQTAYFVRESSKYGIHSTSLKINMKEVYQRKKQTVESFRKGTLKKLKSSDNITLFSGEASFTDPKTIKINTSNKRTITITSDKIFINTGGRPAIPSIEGLDKVSYLDSTSIMDLETLPKNLIILGGGYIGVEFGQMFRRFGSDVSIIQRDKQLLNKEDPDIAIEVKKIFEEDGINVFLNSEVKKIEKKKNTIFLTIKTKGRTKNISGSHLLIAAGHKPNTEQLNLAAAGVKTNERGYIIVNDKLETNIEGIYALGDVKGGPAFTHISYDDYRIIRDNILYNKNKTMKGRMVPYTVFIDPQLGRVGLNEIQAKEKGIDYAVAKMPMSYVARAIEVSQTRGLMKIIIDKKTEKILGCTILGIDGGELMSMLQIAMIGNLKYSSLQNAIFTHPTLAESLNNVFTKIQ